MGLISAGVSNRCSRNSARHCSTACMAAAGFPDAAYREMSSRSASNFSIRSSSPSALPRSSFCRIKTKRRSVGGGQFFAHGNVPTGQYDLLFQIGPPKVMTVGSTRMIHTSNG
eukprot:scaffold1982_cov93-Amphora_coffeaeformis.AAC.27